jgi:hypothetical protein
MTPELCPQCGAEIPDGAKACPECGSDESTGWNERASAQRLDLPDDEDFDHDEFVRDEFGPPRSRGVNWLWILTAVVVLGVLVAWFF